LHDYPISDGDIMSRGQLAWDSSLNTVNIGKFQLGFASIGICEHAFYEAINHASQRVLYSRRVTDFPHVQQMCTESYARLVAAKLFALRATDYFRSASDADRRYLLFNPIQKMKVTSQGIQIIDALLDIIAAKGFEQETYFEMAIRDIGMIPRLEGTEHVNMALVIKFMRNYFFDPVPYPTIPQRDDPSDDAYVFAQKTGGLAKIKFPDYRLAYEGIEVANAGVFREQVELFRQFLAQTTPTEEQRQNIDYMLAVGELFTMTVYAQLCLEAARIYQLDPELLDEIFNFIVRDFAHYALELLSRFVNTPDQERLLRKMLLKPALNPAQSRRVWQDHVLSCSGKYV
jgi:acyl-CoA dehydrogenase